jgi:PAS domain S-box-containing protein
VDGLEALYDALRDLPAPIYVTDAQGVVTFFNQACVGFSGRRPAIGKDRWCVTWKLYTEDGESMPHDQCPMAVALLEKRTIRQLTAVAERPDGTRVTFMPFPTPLLDGDGAVVGAVNMLIDLTEIRQLDELRAQVERCKRLSREIGDMSTKDTLAAMAAEYEEKARELDSALGSAIRPAQRYG